jgi:hypothetical protein
MHLVVMLTLEKSIATYMVLLCAVSKLIVKGNVVSIDTQASELTQANLKDLNKPISQCHAGHYPLVAG